MILVTGATGNIGSELVGQLISDKVPTRVLVRDPTRVAHLGHAVEIAAGDFTKPASLAAACAGIERLFVVAPGGPHMADHAGAAFDAAKAAGVRHVVFVSSGTVALDPPVALGRWHLAAEQRLKHTGLDWTMLRPGNFASNTLRWAGTIRTMGTVFQPFGGQVSAPIDPHDIAAVAKRALTTPGHEGKTYVLTGPAQLTVVEQVEHIGVALGRELRFVETSEEQARAGMTKNGVPPPMVDAILELMRPHKMIDEEDRVWPTVEDVTGHAARTFATWVRAHLAAFERP